MHSEAEQSSFADNSSEERQCLEFGTQRNRYFTGKFLTPDDFQVEQRYFLSRHQLHNRLLHGWGVVCGLHVGVYHDKPCDWYFLTLSRGVAIDSCGRDIVNSEQDFKAHFILVPEWEKEPFKDQPHDHCRPKVEILDGDRLLCLKYVEH